MQNHAISPQAIVLSVWQNRALIKALIRREITGRYRGSMMGIAWSLFNPIFMLTVYTFVFGIIFKSRWNVNSDSKTEFALILFAGLIVFNVFAECVNRAPGLILSNVNYVKKVIFPLEILPWVSLGSAIFHACVGFLVWLCAYLILFGIPQVTVLLLPLVLLPLMLFIMGMTWIITALSVYVRDLAQIIGMCIPVLMFLSPIFYPINALPESYQCILLLNPLTPVIEQTRAVLFWGRMPETSLWIVSCCVSICVAWLGFMWFQKTRKGFADVL